MNIKLVGILFAVGSLLACGDDTTGTAGGTSGGSNPGGSSPGGSNPGGGDTGGAPGTGGDGGGAAFTCQTGCEALFACGLEGTPPNCVFTAADEGTFVPGCVESCADNMALLSIIDTEDCEGTIDTISAVNAQFKDTCDNGISAGGAGGGA